VNHLFQDVNREPHANIEQFLNNGDTVSAEFHSPMMLDNERFS
jgi:hypothetical protein